MSGIPGSATPMSKPMDAHWNMIKLAFSYSLSAKFWSTVTSYLVNRRAYYIGILCKWADAYNTDIRQHAMMSNSDATNVGPWQIKLAWRCEKRHGCNTTSASAPGRLPKSLGPGGIIGRQPCTKSFFKSSENSKQTMRHSARPTMMTGQTVPVVAAIL
jgi:hypothetical protein